MLPGGVWRAGERHRSYGFRPLTGAVELGIAEAWAESSSVPAAVTAALSAAIDEIGGNVPDTATVRSLSVGDRQFLVRKLAGHLGCSRVWLASACTVCGESFDFAVDQAELPAKPASPRPVECASSIGPLTVRPPTGADQEAVAESEDAEAVQLLIERCVRRHGEPLTDEQVDQVLAADFVALDEAFSSCSPEVTTVVTAVCPECDASSEIRIDPYLLFDARAEDLLTDVHTVASAYHWSEAEILALPRARRMQYLARIDQSRGMSS